VKYWGPTRAAWTTPFRAYLEQGLPVSAGTDSPVVPHPPLQVFYHLVTRDTMTGGVMGRDQIIGRAEALRLLTVNNAWLTYEEADKGVIDAGRFADLVVLSQDIMTVDSARLRATTVLLTMVGGRVVHEHSEFMAARDPHPIP
jgi:predicted amidohydrolase YtcJ